MLKETLNQELLIEKCKEIFNLKEYSKTKIKIDDSRFPKCIDIDIETEDSGPEIVFEQLAELSDLLGTRKINLGTINHIEGCGTCGVGSRYYFTIEIKELKSVKELLITCQ